MGKNIKCLNIIKSYNVLIFVARNNSNRATIVVKKQT